VRYLEPPPSFRDQLVETLAGSDDDSAATQPDAFAAIARQPQQQLARAIGEVQSILAGPSIQARCLECPSVAPARVERKNLSLLQMLAAWLS
jgi:protease-4